ncbi:hypothetical protein BGW42_002896 [Actinomortierella wolfii]|nr:hypothetical protein BGW42_002896 [Actinomortierella wolfii]
MTEFTTNHSVADNTIVAVPSTGPMGKIEIEQARMQAQETGSISSSKQSSTASWRSRLLSRKTMVILALGQLLSLCITATSVMTTKLSENQVSIPTTQSFLNYFVLGVVYTSITIYKKGFRGWLHIMRRRAGYYMIFAVVDVEANYFMVKAYSYTSLLSAMLLDSWTIPCVVLLSVFFLKMRFVRYHYLGVFICMVGMALLIWSDMMAGKDYPGIDYVKGDLFCLLGATLYAVSNVYQEFLVRQTPMYEVIGQMGMWATVLNGVQLAILERTELQRIEWNGSIVGYIIGFDIAMFILYSVSPILLRRASATFFNLSLLTSDFYTLIFGIILFKAEIQKLYPVAYVLIISGIIVYNIKPAPEPKFKRILQEYDDKVQPIASDASYQA